MAPKGVFNVDSPIDLSALYFTSEKNIKRNFSAFSVQESAWLIENLGQRFGDPNKDLKKYEAHAVFTLATGNIDNIKNLKNTGIRMYTEPDTLWWKKNRMADYEQTNAYYIKKRCDILQEKGYSKVMYMPTKNRGFRLNGERHPHSWAIVKTDELVAG